MNAIYISDSAFNKIVNTAIDDYNKKNPYPEWYLESQDDKTEWSICDMNTTTKNPYYDLVAELAKNCGSTAEACRELNDATTKAESIFNPIPPEEREDVKELIAIKGTRKFVYKYFGVTFKVVSHEDTIMPEIIGSQSKFFNVAEVKYLGDDMYPVTHTFNFSFSTADLELPHNPNGGVIITLHLDSNKLIDFLTHLSDQM